MSNYLKLFETTNEYTQYIEQGSPLLPNVSYTEDTLKVYYKPIPHDYSKDYFTMVVTVGGHIEFDTQYTDGDISISKDNGETWEIYNSEGIDVYEGDTILVKCMINNSHSYGYAFITNNTSSDVKAKIQGNIMSLLLSDNFMGVSALLESCLYSLFQNCEWLIDAQNLVLPATTLVEECYSNMFYGCINLVYAPKVLPATTLANACYTSMFDGCTSLVTAPELPATTLADSCYFYMFDDCTSLVTAPELPSTTLANSCYESMFYSCTSLTTAPELPATTLADSCYSYMFYGCTSLNYVKAMFTTDISQNNSYTNGWLSDVSATGTFVGNAEASWLDTLTKSDSTVPEGWTIEKE